MKVTLAKLLLIGTGVLFLAHSGISAETVSARSLPTVTPGTANILSNKLATVEVPESVFVDDATRDDPFFPNPAYRRDKIAPTPVSAGGGEILAQLKLTGFGGIGGKRWAMINGVSIYAGESARVRVGGQIYKINCTDIKERSVVVGLDDTLAVREIILEE